MSLRFLAATVGALTVGLVAIAPLNEVSADARSDRVGGENRYETAVEISRRAFPTPDGVDSVYLARGDLFADALSAGVLTDGPVLLVPACAGVPGVVQEEINRLDPEQVVALGGPGAVCATTLQQAAAGRSTDRLGGADRYETAVLISRHAFPDGADEVYLAGGDSPDAVAGGTLTGGPILLTQPGTLPAVTAGEISRVDPDRVIALGGVRPVSEAVLAAASAGRDATRIAGADRYETAVKIADYGFGENVETVYLARGDVYADAVTGGVLTDGPILLVPGGCSDLPDVVRTYLQQATPALVVALGGTAAICDNVLNAAAAAAQPTAEPPGGPSTPPPPGSGGGVPSPGPGSGENLTTELLASARPDECFAGVGQAYPSPEDTDDTGWLICPEGSQPKVNQAYVWGLTKTGDTLWFGTGPNIHCLVLGSYLGMTGSIQTDTWVCEGGDAWYRTHNPLGTELPAALGDWRPPQLFTYDTTTDTLTERVIPDTDPAGQGRLATTLGIRSAGSIGDRVFLAGPGLTGGLNVFVFEPDGTYIGSENLGGYTNIRKWVQVGGYLYTGVGVGTGVAEGGTEGGAVLRYTGSTTADPFQFVEVGRMASEPAELAEHDGRLYASTWPVRATDPASASIASLYMSPVVPETGGLPADATWARVWRADDYEPDPVIARTYGGGALASYGGKLYWGTMHVPGTAALALAGAYEGSPSNTTAEALATVLRSTRAISIFRGDNFDTGSGSVELLYGEAELPVYDPVTDGWTPQPNRMGGEEPLYGPSGLGNTFNNYTWTMATYAGDLYVGTMDWSYLLANGASSLIEDAFSELLGAPVSADAVRQGLGGTNPLGYGADLWRFPSSGQPAVPVSVDGMGNYLSYGIRTMVTDGQALYLGMANPMNLATDLEDDVPEGGWQLLRLTAG